MIICEKNVCKICKYLFLVWEDWDTGHPSVESGLCVWLLSIHIFQYSVYRYQFLIFCIECRFLGSRMITRISTTDIATYSYTSTLCNHIVDIAHKNCNAIQFAIKLQLIFTSAPCCYDVMFPIVKYCLLKIFYKFSLLFSYNM